MLSLEQLKIRLNQANKLAISRVTGVSYNTLLRLADGSLQNPTAKTWQSLSDYFEATVENEKYRELAEKLYDAVVADEYLL